MTKALALLSGGLDSTLAVKVIQDQNIGVIGISYTSPFFSSKKAEKAADMLGIPLRIIDVSDEILEIVKEPKHGHGRFMNPCTDCHSLMVRKAGKLLEELEASFVITGEVLGERPKSQNINSLRIVEKESGIRGYLLRPLSAKLLEPTVAENEGLVDRERLLAFKGRSRKPQFALAKEFGINEFPTPAGGCLLTEEKFSLRLKDLLAEKDIPVRNDLDLLKWGRHFRSSEGAKVIVTRDQNEGEAVEALFLPADLVLQLTNIPGPTALVRGDNIGDATLTEAAALTARYSKARGFDKVSVSYHSGDGKTAGSIEVKSALASINSGQIKVAFIDQ